MLIVKSNGNVVASVIVIIIGKYLRCLAVKVNREGSGLNARFAGSSVNLCGGIDVILTVGKIIIISLYVLNREPAVICGTHCVVDKSAAGIIEGFDYVLFGIGISVIVEVGVKYLYGFAVFIGYGMGKGLGSAKESEHGIRSIVVCVTLVYCDPVFVDGTAEHVHTKIVTAAAVIKCRHAACINSSLFFVIDGSIKYRSFAPIAIEAEIRDRKVDSVFFRGFKNDETVKEGAVYKVCEGSLAIFGKTEFYGNRSGFSCGNGYAVLAEENLEFAFGHDACIIGNALIDNAADVYGFFHCGKSDCGHIIGKILIADIVNGKGDFFAEITVCAVAKLCFGTNAAVNGNISAGIDCAVHLCKACALFSGGVCNAVFIKYRNCSVHKKGVDEFLFFDCGKTGKFFINILLHDCSRTCHVRSSHGSTAHSAIAAARKGGINIAAGCGDFRFKGKVGCNAKAGEVGHKSAVRSLNENVVAAGNRNSLYFLISEHNAVGFGNEDRGDKSLALHIDKVAFNVIENDHADCACCRRIGLLVSESKAAAGNECDFALNVKTFIVAYVAVTGNINVFKGLAVEVAYEIKCGFHIGVIESDLAFTGFDINDVILIFIDTCNGKCRGISGRRTYDTVIRVGKKRKVSCRSIIGCAGFVACGNHKVDACVLNVRINGIGDLICGTEAAGGAKAHVDCINAEDNRVFECRKDDCAGCAAARIIENFKHDDLGVGCNAAESITVRANSTRNVGSVLDVVGYVCVASGVVISERNFCALVKVFRGCVCIEGAEGNKVLDIGKVKFRILGVICKSFVINVETGIKNCGNGAFAGIAGSIGAVGINHDTAGFCGAGIAVNGLDIFIGFRNRNGFYARNGFQVSLCGIRSAYGKAVHNDLIGVFNLKAAAACALNVVLDRVLLGLDAVYCHGSGKGIHVFANSKFSRFGLKNGFSLEFNNENNGFIHIGIGNRCF